MKVAIVTGYLSALSGGVSQAVLPLATALMRRRLAVNLFGLRDPRQPMASHSSAPLLSATFGPWSFGWAPKLRGSIEMARPQLVHAHGVWAFPSLAAYGASERLGVPRLISPHGMLDPWTFRRSSWRRDLAARWFENANLRGAGCIHALNDAEHAAIRAYGLENPIAVVPNGVDLPADTASTDESGRTILFLGRLDAKKNVRELLRAWQLVAADPRADGWNLQITGWGDRAYVADLQRLAAELDIEGGVTFTGPRFADEKARCFRKAAAFILPSSSEGLPMAVLEAWSFSLPVLMSRACNLPEGFATGAASEITTEPEDIARALLAFMETPENDRRDMGRAGHRLVEERFTWERVAAELHAVYTWLLGGGPSPACVVTD